MTGEKRRHDGAHGGVVAALFRVLIPAAEREEVQRDLAAEHAERRSRQGRVAARLWLWRQMVASLPALLRRSVWRGSTGFEPQANRLQPGGVALESWIIDLRYSVRRLVHRPTYTVLAVLTLALGIGGTAAIFSIVRALLLDPLPVAREQQLGVLWFDGSWTQEEFLNFRPHFPGFQGVAAYMQGDQTLEHAGEPLRFVRGLTTSAELFDVLGARPIVGRTFQRGDDLDGAAPVAVLSYPLWQELGGSRAILGTQVRLGGVPRTIVGVMPRGFWFPSPTTLIWTSASLRADDRVGNWTLVGRAAPGVAVTHMDGPLRALASALGRRFKYPAQWDKTRAPAITPLRTFLVGDVSTPLLATLGAMALIFLIACVNVAALMLGQASGRSAELAVRRALGAGRQRLLQQLALESLVIGILAAAVGAALATAIFRTLLTSLPLGALAQAAVLDWTLFASAIALALLAASLAGALPALAFSRGNLQESLATMRTGGLSGRGGRLEGGLVIAQIALAVLLVAGAGLLLRSVANLRAINPGFRVDNTAAIDATLPVQLSNAERHRVVLDMLPVLESLPRVRAVAATEKLPLRGSGDNWGVAVRGKPDLQRSTTAFRIVTHDYFRAMGIRVRRGRGFEAADRLHADRVVVINDALAAKYFPGEDPIGKVLMTFDDRGERIIGIVQNVAEEDLTDPPVPARYMLYEHVPMMLPATSFVVAAERAADVPAVVEAARRAVQEKGRALAVERTQSMAAIFDEAVGPAGSIVTVLALLALLALTLAGVGVYGMVSHFVARRTREYGIRLALGLSPARVVSGVLARGVRLVIAGSAIGSVAVLALSRLIASLLFGVASTDVRAIGGAVGTLLIAGSVAALIPARRASRTDPVVVLREQ